MLEGVKSKGKRFLNLEASLRVQVLGFRFWGLGFCVQGSGFRV